MSSRLTTLRCEDGITLVELLVVILVGGVVFSAALGLTETGARSSGRVSDKVEVIQRSRLAMELITRQLRSQVCRDAATPPIAAGVSDSVVFYNEIDSDPDFKPQRQRIRFDPASNGSVVQESWTPTLVGGVWTFPALTAPATRTRTLVRDIGRLGNNQIFRYYSFDTSTPLETPLDGTLASPTASNSIARVVRVDVSFETLPSSGNGEVSRRSGLRSSVYLRNTDHADGNPLAVRSWGPRCD